MYDHWSYERALCTLTVHREAVRHVGGSAIEHRAERLVPDSLGDLVIPKPVVTYANLTKCIGLENQHNYLFVVISSSYNVLIIIVGVVADLTMYQNLKKRQKIQAKRNENEPIPWKSGNHTESNLRIPLNATIISSCLLLAVSFLSGILAPFVGYDNLPHISSLAAIILGIIEEPLVIILTIKKKYQIHVQNSHIQSIMVLSQGLHGLQELHDPDLDSETLEDSTNLATLENSNNEDIQANYEIHQDYVSQDGRKVKVIPVKSLLRY